MGLVTVALLTLAPLALRPVRLACLIHAANVHSEPGSNPSKIIRLRKAEAPRSSSQPSQAQGPARWVRNRRKPRVRSVALGLDSKDSPRCPLARTPLARYVSS